MIILDTNVVSEPMKSTCAPVVLAWLDRQAVETLFLTTISLAELLFGIASLPEGRRKEGLEAALDDLVEKLFGARILPFDSKAATEYSRVIPRAQTAGRAIAVTDGYIASIAAARGFMIATRDTAPFEAAGLQVINPWTAV